MNIDANVQKVLFALLRKWKLLVLFAIIGALIGYFYTANFTTLTYTSEVKFFAYANDGNDDLSSSDTSMEVVRSSNTSKMNYAMRMMPTYIQIMNTNEFYTTVINDVNNTYNANYQASIVKSAMSISSISDTAMFKVSVTTDDAELSYKIAKQLETTIPNYFKSKNQGLVNASVEDRALKASTARSLGYPKKCTIAAAVGMVLAAAYVALRTLLDVRIRSTDELTEKYSIPVLGAIPDFESKNVRSGAMKGVSNYVQEKES